MKSHKVSAQTGATHRDSNVVDQTAATHRDSNVVEQKPTITHKEERVALILFLTGSFTMWVMFR